MIREKRYSFEEFWAIAHLPENVDKRLELDNGAIVEMPPSSRLNTVTAGRIIYLLNTFVIPRDLGYVSVPDGGYKLGSRTYRQPDVAFIAKARARDLVGVEFDVPPDLAVEVVSTSEDILAKAYEYLQAGTRLFWAVYAEQKVIRVMRLDENGELCSTQKGVDGTLDGGDVLPGLELAVKDIFPD